MDAWHDYALMGILAILGPPFIVSALWLSFVVAILLGGALWGAVRGAWRSFFR